MEEPSEGIDGLLSFFRLSLSRLQRREGEIEMERRKEWKKGKGNESIYMEKNKIIKRNENMKCKCKCK